MGLLVAAAIGVIVFLLVEGRRAIASTSPQSPSASPGVGTQVSASSDWLGTISEAGLGDPNKDLGYGSPSSWLDEYSATDPGIEAPIGPARPYGS